MSLTAEETQIPKCRRCGSRYDRHAAPQVPTAQVPASDHHIMLDNPRASSTSCETSSGRNGGRLG
jgi:hypothetical protein